MVKDNFDGGILAKNSMTFHAKKKKKKGT